MSDHELTFTSSIAKDDPLYSKRNRLRNPAGIFVYDHLSKHRYYMHYNLRGCLQLASCLLLTFILFTGNYRVLAQDQLHLSIHDAIDKGVTNYPSLKAKQNYLYAARAQTQNAQNEYLPNVIASLQQSYGTINGQFGPAAAIGALGVASAGPAYTSQNWNAAFGAMYILSTNWEVFTFGRVRSRIMLGKAQEKRDSADFEQEQFVHRVKTAGAYLSLLVVRGLAVSAQANLERARIVQQTVKARTLSGLNPGVDSSLANAEVSRARLALIELTTAEQTVQRQLAEFVGIGTATAIVPDTSLYTTLPILTITGSGVTHNPQLKFYHARADYANALSDVVRKSILPGVTLFGVYQARASGFENSYNPEDGSDYSRRYSDGVRPSRYNYVTGVSLTWNLMSPLRVRQQVQAQRFVAAGYQQEYDQLSLQLQNQLILADQRIENAMQSANEVPVQLKAASDAYYQKSVLYKNGLTTIVDLQQAMYALNRAEIDKHVAGINVWQALLQKAAASGDFELFINQAQ